MATHCLSWHVASPWLRRLGSVSNPQHLTVLARSNFLLDSRINRLITCINITRGCRSYNSCRSAKWMAGHRPLLCPLPCSYPWLQKQPSRGAGHSKWQNIRHIKAGKDAEKARLSSYISRKIRVAIREGGSSKPESNQQLARAMEEGRKKDVPLSTMQQVIKKFEKSADSGNTMYVEMKGVGNCLLMVETFTDNTKRVRSDLQGAVKKTGATIVKSGLASHSFEHKGVIEVPCQQQGPTEEEAQMLSIDKAMELAIEAGAEEVVETSDEIGSNIYQFLSAPSDLHAVMRELKDQGIIIQSGQLQYLATNHVTLAEEALDIASKMLDKIMENDEVVKIYHNILPADNA